MYLRRNFYFYFVVATLSSGLPVFNNWNKRSIGSSFVKLQVTSSSLSSNPTLTPYNKGYTTCPKESCVDLQSTAATPFPLDLNGTFFRNGPGKFEVGGVSVHPYDGDGLVAAVTFSNGVVTFRNRFVKTAGFQQERRAKGPLSRGLYGTASTGDWLANLVNSDIKNTANGGVVYWSGRLLAMWPSGRPHLLEGDSLRTVGEYALRQAALNRADMCTARPAYDAQTDTGRIVFLVKDAKSTKSDVSSYRALEFNRNFDLIRETVIPIPGPGCDRVESFAVTAKHVIISSKPMRQSTSRTGPLSFLLSKGASNAINAAFNKGTLYVSPRDGTSAASVSVVPSPALGQDYLEMANAHEEIDGTIVIDMLQAPVTRSSTGPVSGSLVRCTLQPGNAQLGCAYNAVESPLSPTKLGLVIGSPVVNPTYAAAKHRYIWALCFADNQRRRGLICLDTASPPPPTDGGGPEPPQWWPETDQYLGPCSFAPRVGETADERDGYIIGYLLTLSSNGSETKSVSELLVFDAADVSRGPVWRAMLPFSLPHYTHSAYAPGSVWQSEDIARRFTACLGLDNKSWNEMKGGFSGLGISYDM